MQQNLTKVQVREQSSKHTLPPLRLTPSERWASAVEMDWARGDLGRHWPLRQIHAHARVCAHHTTARRARGPDRTSTLEQSSAAMAMALADRSRESLLPSFLYSAAAARSFAAGLRFPAAAPSFTIQAPKEKIEMYSPAFYAACTAGGVASCGLTHMLVTPLDLVKCNMQVGG
jgi:hypothetical protein